MAELNPFRALHYNTAKAGPLHRLLTQPYDKISPEMQRRYLEASPYNLAHAVKGEARPADTPGDNVYTRAAEKLKSWREAGILTQDSQPAYYIYHQYFTPPGQPNAPAIVRKGLIALGRVVPYEAGVVFRHEQTLSGPKADRFELLKATRTHLESIFMLYSDPEHKLEGIVTRVVAQPPFADVNDEYGVRHLLWDVREPSLIEAIRSEMSTKKLIIADGHHRYETALKFGNDCAATHPDHQELDCRFAIMTCVNMDDEGVLILPTHRVVAGLAHWNPDELLSKARELFTVSEIVFHNEVSRVEAVANLQESLQAAAGSVRIGAALKGKNALYVLALRSDAPLATLMPELSPAQRSLDVTVLHRLILERYLGMDAMSFQREQHVTYVRDPREAADQVQKGTAQAAFLLNPCTPAQVAEVAFDNRVLPQKSTDFYPKLLSGLTMYPLQH
jgi:uncharacterized protein (DUF1015 family)